MLTTGVFFIALFALYTLKLLVLILTNAHLVYIDLRKGLNKWQIMVQRSMSDPFMCNNFILWLPRRCFIVILK